MGLTTRIRQAGGFDNVDYNSGFYTAGQVTGTVVNAGLAFGNPCALGAGMRAGLQFINGAQAIGGSLNAANNLAQGNYLEAGLDVLGVLGNAGQLGAACFSADTRLMARGQWGRGWRRIDQIAEGDAVLSRDENNAQGPLEWKNVEEVFHRYGFVVSVRVGGQVIKTTVEHPFFVQDKGWLPAGELLRGDLLPSHDGQWLAVEEVSDNGDHERLYNLRVADWHTYFVGAEEWGFSIWAHNACSSTSGNNSASAVGRMVHTQYKNALKSLGYVVEKALKSGKRPDAYNLAQRIVRELKPNNPKAIACGLKQAQAYAKELEAMNPGGGPFRYIVDVY